MINKRRLFFILIFFMIFLGAVLYAQEASGAPAQTPASDTPASDTPASNEPPDDFGEEVTSGDEGPIEVMPTYLLSESGGNVRFIQRISWDKAQYAVRYSVLLEFKNPEMGVFVEALRRNMDADLNYIDVSVPAGDYRYRVYSFNVLGQLDTSTDWEYFTVIKAIQPSLFTFTPDAFYFDRDTPRIIDLTGENLLPDTSIFLVSLTSFDADGQPLIIKPAELHLNELGETARLLFFEDDLVGGKYNIIAENPGGLNTSIGVFSISVAKPFDINVSGGYTPSLTLFGHREYFLDQVFIPLGITLRGSFVPYKLDFGYFGLEGNIGWQYLTSASSEISVGPSAAHLVIFNIDALYQRWLIRKRLSVNGRVGIGMAGIFDYHFQLQNGKSKSYNTAAFSLNIGASVQWFFYKQIFAEAGLDYNHIFHSEFGMGFVRIGLFGGYQF